jgi:hypothetical protein
MSNKQQAVAMAMSEIKAAKSRAVDAHSLGRPWTSDRTVRWLSVHHFLGRPNTKHTS